MFQQTPHDINMSTTSCPMKSSFLELQKNFTSMKSLDRLYFNCNFAVKAGKNMLIGTLENFENFLPMV
jgi:hypothetical protein